MISIVCWKWKPEKESKHFAKRSLFCAEHVNRLFSSIERNTTLRHNFICVTDDWKGLNSAIQVVNIDRHFAEFKDWGGCYRRLRSFDFSTAVALFGGKFISFDIDAVVTGNLDTILGFEEDFKIWLDKHRRRTPYCGSLWGMKSGARQQVWDKFVERPHMAVEQAKRLKYIGTDQAHISASLFPHEKTWGVGDGVYNFNTQVRRQVLYTNYNTHLGPVHKKIDGSLPKGCKIVFFNGKYDPSQSFLQKQYPWIGDCWNG